MKRRRFKTAKICGLIIATAISARSFIRPSDSASNQQVSITLSTPALAEETYMVGFDKTLNDYISLDNIDRYTTYDAYLENDVYKFDREQEEFDAKLEREQKESEEIYKIRKKEAKEQQKMEEKAIKEEDNLPTEIGDSKRYNLSKEQLLKIAAVCMCEQGTSIEGAKWESSLMCNRADLKLNGSDPYTVSQSRWFASGSRSLSNGAAIGKHVGNRGVLTKEIYAAVYDVVVNGNRATRAIEHDCFNDITYLNNNGEIITSPSEIRDRSNYIPNQTIIHNAYGAKYKFLGFPRKNGGDPFGR